MRKWMFLFMGLLLLSGCGSPSQSEGKKKADVTTEKIQTGVTYDASQFSTSDNVYVSEMTVKKITVEQLLAALDIPASDIKEGTDADGQKTYTVQGKTYNLDQGEGYISLYCEKSGASVKKAKEEKLQKQAETIFSKWENLTGVKLDKDHITVVDGEGDKGITKEYECSQIYEGIPLVGNFNMDSPYEASSGKEPGEGNDVILHGSYCFAEAVMDTSEWDIIGIQNFYEEKKKIKLEESLLDGDGVISYIDSYIKNSDFPGTKYETKEASLCYIPIPTSKGSDVVKLTPCWQVLVSGKENWIENGQKKEVQSEHTFYVDAVSGYIYDVKN